MDIYNKISDCLRIFNKIFTWQVLVMFNSWLAATLLVICRNISPTLQKYNIFWSDIFLYSILNYRPIYLAYISGRFQKEHKKTVTILQQVLMHDTEYYDQVKTMLDLVLIKKMNISAKVFPVSLSIVLSFSGQAISFAVLMIQYFYMHQFQ
ncbi:uncharacterized protein LOC128672314 [Plodia interpunctella]|uniref:uncharacterized protein LOC128672314 n=1 Tax=Plodia interpunctella TaxID=58824 RepID=UPI002368BE7B|nr:uncharacterized protein LOC128672314 [Plodia interpunctella]XP_053605351.1 uncharacterized protein LOC128672314 [Plodia interpunctella]XP_053605352.1 uncharacterized protein LOC128672314 [Plodia interpunctella]